MRSLRIRLPLSLAAAMLLWACAREPEPPPQAPAPPPTLVWLEREGRQCARTPWSGAKTLGGLAGYMKERGIQVHESTVVKTRGVVCRACGCPSGIAHRILVDETKAEELKALGFLASPIRE